MLQEIANNIKKDIDKKINSMYNMRKRKLNLISVHNTMLSKLQKHIEVWYEKEIINAEKIENLKTKQTEGQNGKD